MTTIKSTPERTYATIRNSVKVDEDILNHISKTKGISKPTLQMRFPKPGIQKDDESKLEHHQRIYDKSLKMVKGIVKKMFPEVPEDPKFNLKERIDFLNSIGQPTEIQVMDRKDLYQKSILDIVENKITKFEFQSYLFDRASRTAIVSFDVGSTQSHSPEKHIVILFDEDIKSKNHLSIQIPKPNGQVRYFFTDFYHMAATLLLRNMIVEFVNSRHDLAKYAILDFYSDHFGLCQLTISSDLLREKVIAYAKSIGREIRDTHNGEYVQIAELDLKAVMQDKRLLFVESLDYLPVKSRTLTYVILAKEFIRYINALQDKIKNLSINRSEYARAYEMKKGQKFMHIERASNSRLAKYFDEIEFDGEVSVKRFEDFEEDLIELLNGAKFPKIEGSSIRLRKLGRHHAAGMYFIEPKAVVIDFRKNGLKSTLHELLHHFDYTYSKTRQEGLETLHDGLAFRELYDMYTQRVEKMVALIGARLENGEADEEAQNFYTEWNGSTKYNKAYYLREEEVFARLGEIALLDELKNRDLESTLFKTRKDMQTGVSKIVVYPLDNELEEKATEYFKRTLPFLFSQTKG